jgi:hypothetical protein
MSAKTNGGPAFPQNDSEECMHGPGMTLRDWFAGKALGGMLANGFLPTEAMLRDEPFSEKHADNSYVACAYRIADAMLAERSK